MATAAVAGSGLAACGTARTPDRQAAEGRPGVAGDTLFVSVGQWGAPSSFNPLTPDPAWPTGQNDMQLIYESLLRFNLVDGALRPGLATELIESDGGRILTTPLQQGTAWSDGEPLTADDVVFTFEIARSNSLTYSAVWEYLDQVTAVDDRTVEFRCKEQPFNPLPIKNAIATTFIIPRHVWAEAAENETLDQTDNIEPVGSGPFRLDMFDQTQIALALREDYWGADVFGTPQVKKVNHPVFKSNNDADLKLASGDLDASQNFISQIWKMWESGAPVSTWLSEKPYHLPGNIPLLQINQTVKGLDNIEVRRAIAWCIDYPNIATTAMSDYSDPAQASLILPTGHEATFFDETAVQDSGWSHDPERAVEILEQDLGATQAGDGIYRLPDGTRLGPWTLITPTGWTDWNTACEIVAKSCQAVGIDVKTEFPQAPNVTSRMQNGDFELACWSASGVSVASPWSRFRDLLDDRDTAPIGKTTFSNYTRFRHPQVPELLDRAGAAITDEERKAVYGELDAIARETIPVIPLMYRPLEFFEFNESNWTGFPTADDPYAPPMWQGAGIEWLFKIKKVGT